MLRSPQIWLAALFLVGGAVIVVMFDFTADDSYIVLRYAENLIHRGALEYNWGEPINALTSPFHVFLITGLATVSAEPILLNKVFAMLALLATAWIGWRSIGDDFKDEIPVESGSEAQQFRVLTLQSIFVIVVAASPFVALWTVGGLETPYVMLMITALTAMMRSALRTGRVTPRDVLLIGLLVGMAFLGRFDTALYTAPIVGWLLIRAARRPWILAALVPGAIPALGWLLFSYFYFHDILPTSFYTKAPVHHFGIIAKNTVYTLEFTLISGLLLIAAFPLSVAFKSSSQRVAVLEEIKRDWPFWLGLVLIGAYAQATATVHMMFGFRTFLPYLPSAALLIIRLWRRTKADLAIGEKAVIALAATMMAAQVGLTWVVNSYSANPVPGNIAEFPHQSKTDFMRRDLKTLIASTDDIKAHWERQPTSRSRGPRIVGPAAGVVPMLIPNAYVYEVLASERHKCAIDTKNYGDYVQIISPRMGTPQTEFPAGWREANIISRRAMIFDGRPEELIVYYNPNPLSNILPPYIDQPCLDQKSGSVGAEAFAGPRSGAIANLR